MAQQPEDETNSTENKFNEDKPEAENLPKSEGRESDDDSVDDLQDDDKTVTMHLTRIGKATSNVLVFKESDTLDYVMRRVAQEGGPAPPEQRLLYGDQALQDTSASLAKLGLTGEVLVTVLAVPIQWVGLVTSSLGDLGHLAKGMFFENKSFTVEAWVNLIASGSATRTLLAAGKGGERFFCGFTKGKPTLVMGTTEVISSRDPLAEGTWAHLAFIYDRRIKLLRILVGGEEVAAQEDMAPVMSLSYDCRVGASDHHVPSNKSTKDTLEGKLASLGIWTKVISKEDLESSLASGPPPPQRGFVEGLCRYWTFHHDYKRETTYCLDGVSHLRTTLKPEQVKEAKDRPF